MYIVQCTSTKFSESLNTSCTLYSNILRLRNTESTILESEIIGNLNIKTKTFDFVQHFCFYVKFLYHFRSEYSKLIIINYGHCFTDLP